MRLVEDYPASGMHYPGLLVIRLELALQLSVIKPKSRIPLYRNLEINSVPLIGVIDRYQFSQSKESTEFE